MPSPILWKTDGTTPGTAETLNGAAIWKVADIAALKALNTTGYSTYSNDRDIYVIVKEKGIYRYDSSSTLTEDTSTNTVVQPTTGSGRWILSFLYGSGSINTYATIAALKAVNTTGITYAISAFVTDVGYFIFSSGSSATEDTSAYTVVSPTTGGGRWLMLEPVQQNIVYVAGGAIRRTQSAHGFITGDSIRFNSGTNLWVKAQGNSIAGSTNVYYVTSYTTNTFTAQKTGAVFQPGHSLTVGATYYLSATSAGAKQTTMPIGSTSAPLGYYLPLLYVEDANTFHLCGNSTPLFNPTYAEYVATGNVNLNTLIFSNISLNNVGNSLRFELTAEESDTSAGVARVKFADIAAGNYSFNSYYDNGTNWTRDTPTTSANYFELGKSRGSSAGDNFSCHGNILRVNGDEWNLWSHAQMRPASGSSPTARVYTGRTLTTSSNLTTFDLSSSSSNCRLIAGDKVALLIDRMPIA